MVITKQELIDGTYSILTTTIANTRFFGARARGFRSELELEDYVTSKQWSFLSGGQFLFKGQDANGFNRLVYITKETLRLLNKRKHNNKRFKWMY